MIARNRTPGWQRRLNVWLRDAAARRFEYGRHDCALFADRVVEAVTGARLGPEFEGQYKTANGGRKLMRKQGHADEIAFFASWLPEILPSKAIAGDLVVVDGPDGAALGVCGGSHLVVLGLDGLLTLDRRNAVKAFGV